MINTFRVKGYMDYGVAPVYIHAILDELDGAAVDYSYNDFNAKSDPPYQPLYLAKMLRVLTGSGCRRILDV